MDQLHALAGAIITMQLAAFGWGLKILMDLKACLADLRARVRNLERHLIHGTEERTS